MTNGILCRFLSKEIQLIFRQMPIGIVTGKLGKFYEANCLVDMAYVKEDDMTVAQYVAKTAKELGGNITIASFSRFEKGEGIEKKEEDFAAEIEKLASGK